jgi:hypothetical protein
VPIASIFEPLYIAQPWTEGEYTMAINTGAPLYVQLKEALPEGRRRQRDVSMRPRLGCKRNSPSVSPKQGMPLHEH